MTENTEKDTDFDDNDDLGEVSGEDAWGKVAEEEPEVQKFEDDGDDPFTAKAGSAATSTGSEKLGGGGDYSKTQSIMINKDAGCFALIEKAPEGSKGNKFIPVSMENEEGTPCKALRVFIGDGSEINEDRGFYKKSVIYYSKDQQSAINQALSDMGSKKSIAQYVAAYGDCTDGTVDTEIPVDLLDTITAGFYLGKEAVYWKGRKADLARISQTKLINWKRKDNQTFNPCFLEKAINPSSWRVPSRYFYIHVEKFQAVPNDIAVPSMPDDMDGRVLKFTDWASKSFTYFERATATAFAKKNEYDVLEVLNGGKRAEFDKWIQKLVLNITLAPVPTKSYGVHQHPRFWAKVKEDRVVNEEVKAKGCGISLWEAMHTREFAIAVKGNRNAKPFSDDEVKVMWADCCGTRMIQSKGGRTTSVEDTSNYRKNK